MNFMAIIRSLEEFVYEIVTWLVFYPRLFLQVLLRPMSALAYARGEFGKPEDQRFDAALSPLLFLLLSLLISHLAELAWRETATDVAVMNSGVLSSDFNLVVFRSVLFAAFPLAFAVEEVASARTPLARSTLMATFYVQCLPAAVYALVVGLGFLVEQRPGGAAIGWSVVGAASLWYLAVQTGWRRRDGRGWGRAVAVALGGFIAGWAAVIGVGLLLQAVG